MAGHKKKAMSDIAPLVKQEKIKLQGMVRYVYKQMGKAIADYHMLSQGDRILIAISGSRGSLCLFKLFKLRQIHVPIQFDIVACLINSKFTTIDKKIIKGYFDAEGIECLIRETSINEEPAGSFWCTAKMREALYETASEYKCNKIALGHTLDDIIQITLLNLCFKGKLTTWQPLIEMPQSNIAVIRPLCYLQKKDILACARQLSLPDASYSAFYSKDNNRKRIEEVIGGLDKEYPFIKKNIFRSFKKIKHDYLL